jgi:glycosyltransferase involved in cell wall biosynthesis
MLSIAVSSVRNCADIVALTVLHHCLLGVDHCVVVDNGSTDGTGDLLKAISKRVKQVTVLHDPSPYEQDKIVSGVVNEFTRRQPTLVIPFDADEFWDAPVAKVAGYFDCEGVNVVECNVINFVQSRSVVRPIVVGDERALVRVRRHSFVEVEFPRKVLFRATGQTEVAVGAHNVKFSDKKKKTTAGLSVPARSMRGRAVS